MNRYEIGHVTIGALGFLMGSVFAMIIAPGDALVLIGVGIVFGFSASALFDQNFGGDWFWPFGRPAGRKTLAAKASIAHRYRTKSERPAGRHLENTNSAATNSNR